MSAPLRKCFDDWQFCASSATGPTTEAELIRKKTGQSLVALTSTFSVELPGIEPGSYGIPSRLLRAQFAMPLLGSPGHANKPR